MGVPLYHILNYRRMNRCNSCQKKRKWLKDGLCIDCRSSIHIGKRFGSIVIIDTSRGNRSAVCDCGREFPIKLSLVLIGSVTSCGCGANRKKLTQDRYRYTRDDGDHIGRTIAYSTRVSDAKRRGLVWELSREKWSEIVAKPCLYCGAINSNRIKGRKRHDGIITNDFLYNGVDRYNNTIGYTEGNSVPCCKLCNRMKNDKTFEQFIDHVKSIFVHLKLDDNA